MDVEFFDIESINVSGKTLPYCISYTEKGVISFNKFQACTKTEAALFIINNFNSKGVYYSHNLAFDFFLIIEGLKSVKAKVEIVCVEGNLYAAYVTYGKKKIKFRCSLKLIRVGLKNFYPDLYYKKKLEMPFDFDSVNGPHLGSLEPFKEEDYMERNITDVEILMNGYWNFIKCLLDLDMGKSEISKHYTPGGIVLSFFVKKYNSINLSMPCYQKRILKPYFYGGRCEIFGNKKNSEKVYYFDYYGMYHLSMYEPVPDGLFTLEDNFSNDVYLPGFYYIEAEIYSDIPVLPIKLDKLMFTNGYVTGWYWFEEILLALSNSRVVSFRVHKILRCNRYEKFLNQFASDMEGFKKKSSLHKKIGKMLVNSFYGRLGLGDDLEMQHLSENETGLNINDNFIKTTKIKQKPLANVAVAMVIAAKARIRLYQAFLDIKKNGGRVLYCDTDSVFAAFDEHNKIENLTLGPSNIIFGEENKVNDCIFYKPKTYGVVLNDGTEVIKIKGTNNNSVTFSEFKNTKGDLILNKTDINKRNANIEVVHRKIKIDLGGYDKRIFVDGNRSTKPILNRK